jgi:hypothetical protein
MAVSGTAYDPKGFSFLIAEQDAYGTANGAGGNSFIALDVDSIGSPTLGVVQALDVRSGSRVLQETDFHQSITQSVKEFSVSGTATTEGLDLLLSHFCLDASVPYVLASNLATASYKSGTTTTANQILTIVFKSAYGTDADLTFKDCLCTALSFSGDAGTEGGRIKFSATFQSGSVVEDLTDATTTIDTAITANNYYMSSWDADDRIIAGTANAVLSSFSLDLTNPVVFSGISAGGFEVATRSGEVSATANFSVVYDTNFVGMFEAFNGQTTATSKGITLMGSDNDPGDGAFEFQMPKSIITDVAFNEGSVMMLDITVKAVGAGIGSSADLIEVTC